MLRHRTVSSYRVTKGNGAELRGETIGYVETAEGLFLFPPADADGRVQRLFIPRNAFASFDVGPRIGRHPCRPVRL